MGSVNPDFYILKKVNGNIFFENQIIVWYNSNSSQGFSLNLTISKTFFRTFAWFIVLINFCGMEHSVQVKIYSLHHFKLKIIYLLQNYWINFLLRGKLCDMKEMYDILNHIPRLGNVYEYVLVCENPTGYC